MRKLVQWKFGRVGREWTEAEFEARLEIAPEKIEYVDGIFANDHERLAVLAMLIENLGIDRVVEHGDVGDWKAAIGDREARDRR